MTIDIADLFRTMYEQNINKNINCIVIDDGEDEIVIFNYSGHVNEHILRQVKMLANYLEDNECIVNAKEYFEVFDENIGDFIKYKWSDKN